jgi:RNA polymerase sigma-70 factor (ECF subfamily)
MAGIGELVVEAQKGNEASFAKLVALNQGRVFGYAVSRLGKRSEAEDAVQETFIRAFIGLKTLGNPEYFGSWLFSICRNTVSSMRRKARKEETLALDREPAAPDGTIRAEWENYRDCLRMAYSTLPERDREILGLKYYSSLSYGGIASLLKTSPALVKSRLHEARKKLKKVLPSLYQGIELSPLKQTEIKERIMRQLELMKKAATVVRKMSFNGQLALCGSVEKGEKFPDAVLSEMGDIKDGKEIVAGYGGRMSLQELIGVLNMNRELENWLVGNLEKENSGFAEAIKQHHFVFEDIVFVDREVMAKLVAELGGELTIAISNVEAKVKNHVLSVLSPEERADRLAKWLDLDTSLSRVYEAQGKVVGQLHRWVEEGLIESMGPNNPDPLTGLPLLRMRKRN